MASSQETIRDRAIWFVRLATTGSVAGAFGLTWLFSGLAESYFSGRAPAPQTAPTIPTQATPVQKPPDVITTVVHHPSASGSGGAPSGGAPAPRPPSQPPAAGPPPPPPPICHSTPTKPC